MAKVTLAERSEVRRQLLYALDRDRVPGRWFWRYVIRLADWIDA